MLVSLRETSPCASFAMATTSMQAILIASILTASLSPEEGAAVEREKRLLRC